MNSDRQNTRSHCGIARITGCHGCTFKRFCIQNVAHRRGRPPQGPNPAERSPTRPELSWEPVYFVHFVLFVYFVHFGPGGSSPKRRMPLGSPSKKSELGRSAADPARSFLEPLVFCAFCAFCVFCAFWASWKLTKKPHAAGIGPQKVRTRQIGGRPIQNFFDAPCILCILCFLCILCILGLLEAHQNAARRRDRPPNSPNSADRQPTHPELFWGSLYFVHFALFVYFVHFGPRGSSPKRRTPPGLAPKKSELGRSAADPSRTFLEILVFWVPPKRRTPPGSAPKGSEPGRSAADRPRISPTHPDLPSSDPPPPPSPCPTSPSEPAALTPANKIRPTATGSRTTGRPAARLRRDPPQNVILCPNFTHRAPLRIEIHPQLYLL
jgi:hypothetical protein